MAINDRDWARFRQVAQQAAARNANLFEELERYDMLTTEEQVRKIQVSTLEQLWKRLESKSAADIMTVYIGRNSGTPHEMHRALLDWLEAVIKATADGTLED